MDFTVSFLRKKNHTNKTLSRVKFMLPQVEYLISNVKEQRATTGRKISLLKPNFLRYMWNEHLYVNLCLR